MDNRRLVVCAAIAIGVLMAAFPPWSYTFRAPGVVSATSAGYHFVAAPPVPARTDARSGVALDGTRLVLQWAATAGVAALLLVVLGKDDERSGKH
jgi:hypothetical protein